MLKINDVGCTEGEINALVKQLARRTGHAADALHYIRLTAALPGNGDTQTRLAWATSAVQHAAGAHAEATGDEYAETQIETLVRAALLILKSKALA